MRVRIITLFAAVVGAGCASAGDGPDDLTEQELATTKASCSLSGGAATFAQTSETGWTLSKTGAIDTTAKTITWTIEATRVATDPHRLIANGYLDVTNSGAAPATIGNIVANLQTKAGSSWVTR